MINYRFSKNLDADFSSVLKKRVNAYFQEHQLSKNADSRMVRNSILALSVYILPYLVVVFGGISSIPILFGLWITMGVGVALIGTSIMHDAVHGSYSNKRFTNRILSLSAPLLGVDDTVWKFQHNVLHHTYTNIENADEDIQARFVMRFSPHQPKKWFHRFQHIYALFFYGISTLIWVSVKDFVKLTRYKNQGFISKGKEYNYLIARAAFRKLIYILLVLVLPMVVLPVPNWMVVLMFVSMHIATGLLLSFIFQSAHVNDTADYINQEDPQIDRSWSAHQLYTTSNFAVNSKFVTWLTGGLNFQVEHHLFPNICHIHYPKISEIVKKTTEEYNLPYYAQESFISAILSHFKALRELGRA